MTFSTFDTEALVWFARRADPSKVIADAWPAPSWGDGCRAIEEVFGLEHPSHFLRHHAGFWSQLWERQITQGVRDLLVNNAGLTLARSQALLNGLDPRSGVRLATIDSISADAADRMDLAIYCRDESDNPHCIVIEAKLDSELSDTQLSKYKTILSRQFRTSVQRHLWVIAPRKTSRTAALLGRQENREWRFATWRQFLVRWQKELPTESGADALYLFSEIWKRVGGR